MPLRVPPSQGLLWWLPGHGDPLADCGRWSFFAHRQAHESHWRRGRRRCGRFACPSCALQPGGWADRESWAIADRLRAGQVSYGGRPIHVVVSPPPDVRFDVDATYRRLRGRMYRVSRSWGFRGGAAVFHDRRLGAARFNAGRSLGCRRGPHFHLIGFGWIVPPSENCVACRAERAHRAEFGMDPWHSHLLCGPDVFKRHTCPPESDWIVKNLGVRRSVRATARYILSHSAQGILPMPDLRGPEVVTWFGNMAYNKLRSSPASSAPVFCRVCGADVPLAEWFLVSWCGQGPPPGGDHGVCEGGLWATARPPWWDPQSNWREIPGASR